MIAFLIGLTFSLTYGNTFSSIYNHDISVSNPVFIETPVTEPEIKLEDWMLELPVINTTYEQEIELEDWMINLDKFYRNSEVSEDQPELEDWMLQNSFDQEDGQKEIIIENWMFYFS